MLQPVSFDKKAAAYQHPQSSYFAGYPLDPHPNAQLSGQKAKPAVEWSTIKK